MKKKGVNHLLLGVTGSIASYKSPHLVRLLRKAGWQVKVILTEGGSAFVTRLALETLSGDKVYTRDSLKNESHSPLFHIDLARWAHVVLIAPASANVISRLARGEASGLLSSVFLATTAPLFIAPGMNEFMWLNPATQTNRKILEHRGVRFLGPDIGEQACGDMGYGRFREPEDIVKNLDKWREEGKVLMGLKILVSAGGTREPLDPVRFIGNRSSGKMGYAFAQAAQEMGANVILVSTPTSLCVPVGVEVIYVKTAREMEQAIFSRVDQVNIFVSAAAVSDWRAKVISPYKIKEKKEEITISLVPNPDILGKLGKRKSHPFLVGFSSETDNLLENARFKKKEKGVDIMIANDVSINNIGFESEKNAVWLLSAQGEEFFPSTEKKDLARILWLKIKESYDARS